MTSADEYSFEFLICFLLMLQLNEDWGGNVRNIGGAVRNGVELGVKECDGERVNKDRGFSLGGGLMEVGKQVGKQEVIVCPTKSISCICLCSFVDTCTHTISNSAAQSTC
jgi:hypothetical protein